MLSTLVAVLDLEKLERTGRMGLMCVSVRWSESTLCALLRAALRLMLLGTNAQGGASTHDVVGTGRYTALGTAKLDEFEWARPVLRDEWKLSLPRTHDRASCSVAWRYTHSDATHVLTYRHTRDSCSMRGAAGESISNLVMDSLNTVSVHIHDCELNSEPSQRSATRAYSS